jgi:hypothetical protein
LAATKRNFRAASGGRAASTCGAPVSVILHKPVNHSDCPPAGVSGIAQELARVCGQLHQDPLAFEDNVAGGVEHADANAIEIGQGGHQLERW